MGIDPKRYGPRRNPRNHRKAINIRLRRRKRLGVPTQEDVVEALQYMLDNGNVPDGWQFAMIEWTNPAKASYGWVEGEIHDFDRLAPVIQASLYDARIALVRPGE